MITRLKVRWLRRRARNLMLPFVIRCDIYSCGSWLLQHICPVQWNDYRKGLALARLARMIERKQCQKTSSR